MIEVRSNSDRTSCLKRKPTFLIFFADSHGGGLIAAGRGRVSEPSAGGGHQGEGRQGGHGLAEVRGVGEIRGAFHMQHPRHI